MAPDKFYEDRGSVIYTCYLQVHPDRRNKSVAKAALQKESVRERTRLGCRKIL